MAKTYGGLYPRIYNFGNLFLAYQKARKGKRYKENVLAFSCHLEENLIQIQNELIWKTFTPGRCNTFYIYEPKKRLITAAPFRDRVLHHALCNIVEPIWESRFIADSYACRPGKGTHAAADKLTALLRRCKRNWGRVYCLKADISKYFPSIDHDTLKRLLRKRIACPETLWLCDVIIDSTGSDTGVPIGNLTSQLFANVYLHELDELVKYTLRERFYIRYMDDFIILAPDKTHLHHVINDIADYLQHSLRLQLNRKTQIFPVESRGIDFLGYHTWATHRLLRASNAKRAKRKIRTLQKLYRGGKITPDRVIVAVQSWVAHCKHADTYRLRKKVLEGITLKPKCSSTVQGVPDTEGVTT